jgi:hypothetical protein
MTGHAWYWLFAGLVAALMAMGLVGLYAQGARRWSRFVRPLAERLEAGRREPLAWLATVSRYDVRELEGLPAPVRRYFQAALCAGQPIVAAVTFAMKGTFNQSATGEHWKSFRSRQRVVTRRPGFLWDARISMLPGLRVRVVDSYVAGSGHLHAAVAGLVTVADMQGGGEVAHDEFMRYFAETPWYPTALLPSQGVRWTAVDERSAHATLADGPLSLTLLFRFNGDGLVDSVHSDARGALVDGRMVMMPWECSMSRYARRNGMMVPDSGEAAWMRPAGRKAYFRGTLTSLAFDFAP